MRAVSFLCMITLLYFSPTQADEEITFIVNKDNPLKEISHQDLADMFLKKKREWPDGSSVRFIDRKVGTPERTTFLSNYVKRSGREVDLYWIGQKLYSGNAAPIQMSTDSNAESLVSSFKGAIGYVSSGFPLGKDVKKITIQGGETP